ncbi:TetR/AcrR family transcriptional regulator [Brevundimonas sp.]|uniref:TetR/AcrR family transcriptional regulator n=1 Tax=Brevundimonas sp. TaxID=1871086 RepID=UPI001205222D|nr:TetR/AcrR family transcriptional regulator [Brevundimonas sp.]TAJ55507.1 MAG: TetR/AcrR family transcriptional regulator [Brevundimonas sp.]
MSTRDAIVAAAGDLLDEAGPEAVTLRAVAQRVGLSHNAPYKHFADKEALLAAVATVELRRRADAPRPAGGEPLATLKRMVRDNVRWAVRHPARFKLTYGSWTRHDNDLGEAAHAARMRFVEAVAAAQAVGALAPGDPERVSAMLLALGHGAADLALGGHLSREGKGHADPEDLVDDLFDLFERSARPSDHR